MIRLIFSIIFTLCVFVLLLGFVAFRCMHPAGSHMLASTLSSYPYVDILPKIFFAPGELDEILKEQAAAKEPVLDSSEDSADESVKTEMLLGEGYDRNKTPVSSNEFVLLDGMFVVQNDKKGFSDSSVNEEKEPAAASEPASSVLYGCVKGAAAAYLRQKPLLDAQKVLAIEPGTWCVVVSEETPFIKILYEGTEYYIYHDRLDVFEVPELPEGVLIPGLTQDKQTGNETSGKNEVTRKLRGYVAGITPYRSKANLNEPQAGFLDPGTDFEILDTVNSFYKFLLNGNECYVYETKVTTYYEETVVPDPAETPDSSNDTSTLEN
ncbi:MAG: hypothetical protein IIW08_00040 [Clostridia bacterium]|nr:hypothetical protein [Clostridia bacterium]